MFRETPFQIVGLTHVQTVGGRALQHIDGKHFEGVWGSPRGTRTYNLAVNPPQADPLCQLWLF